MCCRKKFVASLKGVRREIHVEEIKMCLWVVAATVVRTTPAPSSERICRWLLSPAAWQLELALLALASQTQAFHCITVARSV